MGRMLQMNTIVKIHLHKTTDCHFNFLNISEEKDYYKKQIQLEIVWPLFFIYSHIPIAISHHQIRVYISIHIPRQSIETLLFGFN